MVCKTPSANVVIETDAAPVGAAFAVHLLRLKDDLLAVFYFIIANGSV
jgi:hypothetical protein